MKKSIISFSWAFLLPVIIFAQTHVWTGNGGDDDWFNSANWDVNTVPDAGSSVAISTNASVRINSSNAAASSIALLASSALHLSSTLFLENELQIAADSEFVFEAGTLNGGVIENQGLLKLETLALKTLIDVVINNDSEFLVSNSNQIQLNNVEINNDSGSEINIASVGGFLSQGSAPSVLNNNGLLRKVPDGVNPVGNFYLILDINNSGVIDISGNETFLCLGGNITLNNLETGIIRGNGTFDITAEFINTGIIAPGGESSVGTFHITNNFNLSLPGALLIDIGNNPTLFDVIEVVGTPLLEGDIFVECQTTLTPGDEFPIITATNGIGNCNFPQFVYADLFASSYEFEVICAPNTVILKYVREVVLNNNEFEKTTDIYVIPNPVAEQAKLIFPSELLPSNEGLELHLYNSNGIRIKTSTIESTTAKFDTSDLSAGLYLVGLVADGQVLGTTKLVKL